MTTSKVKKEIKGGKKSTTKAAVKETKKVLEPMNRAKARTFQEITLTEIKVNPLNPRKNFSGPKYDELLASVRTKGVIVPVLLRPIPETSAGEKYEIIAGERRFRASCEVAKGNGGMKNAKIPAIVQEMTDDDAYDCMTIENLQRADLTPLEEAWAFKLYLDRKGPESLQDLAERVGINPCYIRRRTAVLVLPEKMLKSWEEGEITHGHLEQLIRVSDPKDQMDLYEQACNSDWMTVKRMKEQIEARTPKLSGALFAKTLAGCPKCAHNTDVQRNLFGEDVAAKALCLNPKCYKNHQGEWIRANWDKFKKMRNLETNGFVFEGEVSWEQRHNIYANSMRTKCKTCEHLKSIITLTGGCDDKKTCLGSKQCHDALYNSSSSAAKKAADPNAPRVSWHGEFFREEFYKTRIPELMTVRPPDDEKVLRITLLTILELHPDAAEAFRKKNNVKHSGYYCDHSRVTWPLIQSLSMVELRSMLQELSLLILMDPRNTTAPTRRQVAGHLGADLAIEWRLTQEYLDKKTTKEIHAIAEQFGFFKDDKARAYLYETLGKKRDRFDLCKKAELVKVILESGVDLTGKVPDEILK